MAEQKAHRILLVDDDQFILDMYAQRFTMGGHEVRACFGVDEALKELRGGYQPEGIVFDIRMPGKDGFDLLHALKEEKLAPTAKLIALTNQSSDEEKAKAKELGAQEYIVKVTREPSEVVAMVVSRIESA